MAVPVFIARLWSGLCGPLCANGTKNEDLVLLLPIFCAFFQQPAQPANQPGLGKSAEPVIGHVGPQVKTDSEVSGLRSAAL